MAAPYSITSSYGLFRSMTGVGSNVVDAIGRTRSVVARPELIIEGTDDGIKWYPFHFKHKPGDPNVAPTWVAPHQPRLDWQVVPSTRVPSHMTFVACHCDHVVLLLP
jgi:hypothetical protein